MKNYYEILEVDKKASKEVIEKAYKALAIKYHPDLKEGSDKKVSETKMMEINEAYNVLSDEARRAEYDNKFRIEQESSYGNSEFLRAENNRLKQELARIKGIRPQDVNNIENNSNSTITEEEYNRILQQKINEARQKAYHDAYVDDMQRRGYHVVYHETPKQKLKKVVFVIIYILVVALILRLPPVRNAIRSALPFLSSNGI